jgi:hypothetical protein
MLGASERRNQVDAVAVKTMGCQLKGTLTPNLVKADTMHRMSTRMVMMMGVGCCGMGEKGYVNLWAQKIREGLQDVLCKKCRFDGFSVRNYSWVCKFLRIAKK